MDAQELGRKRLEENLELIEDIVRFVARKHRLAPDLAEDLGGFVRLRLLERAGEVLGVFEGRSTLRTYLATVVERLYLDFQIQRWGKWRPSRPVERLGPIAVELDQLLHRDGRSFDEALGILRARHPKLPSREELAHFARAIPPRRTRPIFLDLEAVEGIEALPAPAAQSATESRAFERDRRATVRHTWTVLSSLWKSLPPEDRQLLQLRFERGLTVRRIAQQLGHSPRNLYARFDRLLGKMRRALERKGVRKSAVGTVIEP